MLEILRYVRRYFYDFNYNNRRSNGICTFTNEEVMNSENITPTGKYIPDPPIEPDRKSHQ